MLGDSVTGERWARPAPGLGGPGGTSCSDCDAQWGSPPRSAVPTPADQWGSDAQCAAAEAALMCHAIRAAGAATLHRQKASPPRRQPSRGRSPPRGATSSYQRCSAGPTSWKAAEPTAPLSTVRAHAEASLKHALLKVCTGTGFWTPGQGDPAAKQALPRGSQQFGPTRSRSPPRPTARPSCSPPPAERPQAPRQSIALVCTLGEERGRQQLEVLELERLLEIALSQAGAAERRVAAAERRAARAEAQVVGLRGRVTLAQSERTELESTVSSLAAQLERYVCNKKEADALLGRLQADCAEQGRVYTAAAEEALDCCRRDALAWREEAEAAFRASLVAVRRTVLDSRAEGREKGQRAQQQAAAAAEAARRGLGELEERTRWGLACQQQSERAAVSLAVARWDLLRLRHELARTGGTDPATLVAEEGAARLGIKCDFWTAGGDVLRCALGELQTRLSRARGEAGTQTECTVATQTSYPEPAQRSVPCQTSCTATTQTAGSAATQTDAAALCAVGVQAECVPAPKAERTAGCQTDCAHSDCAGTQTEVKTTRDAGNQPHCEGSTSSHTESSTETQTEPPDPGRCAEIQTDPPDAGRPAEAQTDPPGHVIAAAAQTDPPDPGLPAETQTEAAEEEGAASRAARRYEALRVESMELLEWVTRGGTLQQELEDRVLLVHSRARAAAADLSQAADAAAEARLQLAVLGLEEAAERAAHSERGCAELEKLCALATVQAPASLDHDRERWWAELFRSLSGSLCTSESTARGALEGHALEAMLGLGLAMLHRLGCLGVDTAGPPAAPPCAPDHEHGGECLDSLVSSLSGDEAAARGAIEVRALEAMLETGMTMLHQLGSLGPRPAAGGAGRGQWCSELHEALFASLATSEGAARDALLELGIALLHSAIQGGHFVPGSTQEMGSVGALLVPPRRSLSPVPPLYATPPRRQLVSPPPPHPGMHVVTTQAVRAGHFDEGTPSRVDLSSAGGDTVAAGAPGPVQRCESPPRQLAPHRVLTSPAPRRRVDPASDAVLLEQQGGCAPPAAEQLGGGAAADATAAALPPPLPASPLPPPTPPSPPSPMAAEKGGVTVAEQAGVTTAEKAGVTVATAAAAVGCITQTRLEKWGELRGKTEDLLCTVAALGGHPDQAHSKEPQGEGTPARGSVNSEGPGTVPHGGRQDKETEGVAEYETDFEWLCGLFSGAVRPANVALLGELSADFARYPSERLFNPVKERHSAMEPDGGRRVSEVLEFPASGKPRPRRFRPPSCR
eukprot:TRINITY_DN2162_c0_g1_i2.p1 TRINITY_DN2162_c0_g1~~TRINITY_DN2162_c0_g1_i2.p1  ORF type:complete len:1283 (+),score=244.43 TRINITY_DN2162_c0_g1_i2:74-3850(+)